MERQPVDSSSVRSIGYDARSHLLEVEFCNGSVYRYLRVPQTEWRGLLTAESKGSYMNTEIKPRYEVLRISGDDG